MKLPKDLYQHGFGVDQIEIIKPIDVDSLTDIREFIRENWTMRKTIFERSSYSLKHVAERGIGRYVSNGDLIASMILEGYRHRVIDKGPNAYFNVDQKSIAKSDEIPPKRH